MSNAFHGKVALASNHGQGRVAELTHSSAVAGNKEGGGAQSCSVDVSVFRDSSATEGDSGVGKPGSHAWVRVMCDFDSTRRTCRSAVFPREGRAAFRFSKVIRGGGGHRVVVSFYFAILQSGS